MANNCYTKYRFEGPEAEIRYMGNRLLETFARHPFEEADAETRYYSSKEYYEQNFSHIVDALYPGTEGGRGAVRGKITEESYRSLGDGTLVLAFETKSAYVPENIIWDEVLRQWAPNSRYYYYAEELALEGAWTNDVYRKYFPWDYVVYARVEQPMPDVIFDFLTKNAVFREDQYAMHATYWRKDELRKALLKLLPHPEWSTDNLIYVARKELERFAEAQNMWIQFFTISHHLEDEPELYSEEDYERASSGRKPDWE
ncbi:hypothetical protein [Megasphaera sp. DISK 18]|uniref:hypothetical protein n=1 Tax=Megasphaera sp. DISK 18 TaxID=1776081 RepID=UPI0008071AC6|nr:hypothetical protein [Megasphaera sp. DISK 18]OBZ32497.1 hypothetical protein A0U42_10345 [Megasphaera sp. DISK 18]